MRLWAAALCLSAWAAAPARASAPAKPRIHARADWGAADSRVQVADETKARIIVHHTDILVTDEDRALKDAPGFAAAAEHAKKVLYLHKTINGWSDIGYHYLIDWEGRVLQGRPVDLLGAHTDDNNEGSIGIALMGAFEQQHATAAQLEALRALAAWLTHLYGIPATKVLGHHDYNATACPGLYLDDRSDPQSPLRLVRLSLLASQKLAPQPKPQGAPKLESLEQLRHFANSSR